jgi:hypothetical protein
MLLLMKVHEYGKMMMIDRWRSVRADYAEKAKAS